jgi:hypothetical protein
MAPLVVATSIPPPKLKLMLRSGGCYFFVRHEFSWALGCLLVFVETNKACTLVSDGGFRVLLSTDGMHVLLAAWASMLQLNHRHFHDASFARSTFIRGHHGYTTNRTSRRRQKMNMITENKQHT